MHATEPLIDAVQVDMIGPALDHLSSCCCDRDLAEAMLLGIGDFNERMAGARQVGHQPKKRAIPHEDRLLLTLRSNPEFYARERTLFPKEGKGLALRTGQA